MFKERCLRKYVIKFSVWICAVIFVCILIVSLSFNIILANSKRAITQAFDGDLTHTITIGKIFYVFPRTIILKDVVMQDRSSKAIKPFAFPRADLKLSVFDFFVKWKVSVTRMLLEGADLDHAQFYDFLKNNGQTILSILRQFPKKNFRIHIKDVKFHLTENQDPPGFWTTDFLLMIKGDMMTGFGMIRQDRYHFSRGKEKARAITQGLPLRFDFKALLNRSGFTIENLTLERKNFYSQLWGESDGSRLLLNGFLFVNAVSPEDVYPKPFTRLVKRIKEGKAQPGIFSSMAGDLTPPIYLLDINCHLRMSFPQIDIERLWFTVNNVSVNVTGGIVFADPTPINLNFSFYPSRLSTDRAKYMKKIDVGISGLYQNKTFHSQARMDIYLADHDGRSHDPEKIAARLNDVRFLLNKHGRITMDMGEGSFSFWANANEHRINLQNLQASLNYQDYPLKTLEVHSPFYGGSLWGRAWFNTTQFPLKITAVGSLKDVEVNHLDDLLVHFSKFHGRLSSKIYFNNHPQLSLNGDIQIERGHLKDFEFFKWLADAFALPQLRAIDFERAFSNFSVKMESAGLSNISLESKDVGAHGYFMINRDELVSSKLSLNFSRGLLHKSPKFRPILKLFRRNVPSLIFDFQLSGNQHAMNFQWLQSDFKQKIQRRIPDFIERQIEGNIDKMLKTGNEIP